MNKLKVKRWVMAAILQAGILAIVFYLLRHYLPFGEDQNDRERVILAIISSELAAKKMIKKHNYDEASLILEKNIIFVRDYAHLFSFSHNEVDAIKILIDNNLSINEQ